MEAEGRMRGEGARGRELDAAGLPGSGAAADPEFGVEDDPASRRARSGERDGVLDRALTVFALFSEDEPSLTAAQISERSGLPESTLFRLLSMLVERGLLARLPGRSYAIGARLWEFGELSPLALRLREQAIPHLMRLYEVTGENVHLGVLDGAPESASVLFVGRVTGRRSVPTVSRAGGRGPLHTTGVGRALLATRDDAWLDRFFSKPLERETTKSLTEEAPLREDLARTRKRGYAVTREEMTLGNISVAASCGSIPGLPPVAVGLVVHLDLADERMLAGVVQRTARELAAELKS